MIDIKLVNSEDELASFPITQTLKLESNVRLDDSVLNDHIILFRLYPEKGLVSLAEPYIYSFGYIKEKFDTIDLNFTQTKVAEGKYEVDISPTKPLNVNSDYVIYVTNKLMNSRVNVVKSNSKSVSTVTGKINHNSTVLSVVTVEVLSTSKLTSTSNITKFLINNSEVELNLKETTSYSTIGFDLQFKDTVYLQGELFTLSLNTEHTLDDLQYQFKTAASDTINPIQSQTPSSTINTQDILNFYKQVSDVKESTVIYPTYQGMNRFTIPLPDGYTLDPNNDVVVNIKEAFNNYLLNSLELYEDSFYTLYIYQEDNFLVVEVVYDTIETTVRDDDENLIKFKLKRSRR